jgi:hypothetical protein
VLWTAADREHSGFSLAQIFNGVNEFEQFRLPSGEIRPQTGKMMYCGLPFFYRQNLINLDRFRLALYRDRFQAFKPKIPLGLSIGMENCSRYSASRLSATAAVPIIDHL